MLGNGIALACLQKVSNKVDAPAGAIPFVPRLEIGGAGRQAESTVDACLDGIRCFPGNEVVSKLGVKGDVHGV